MMKRPLALAFILLTFLNFGYAQNQSEELLAAARKSDVAAVKAMLDKGVDVNSKNRYGATALSYACDRGSVEMVRLLIERGADVNVEDTFYHATPLGWAADKGYVEIVKLLLDKGAKGKEDALQSAVFGGHTELVKSLLARGDWKPEGLTAALSAAERGGKKEIAEILKNAGATPAPKPSFQVDEATLKSYAGTYKHEQIGTLTFTFKDGKLIGQVTGQGPFPIGAFDKKTFTAIEDNSLTIIFNSVNDKVTSVTLKQGAGTYEFKRVE
jgi:ankyrin repeat protein